MTVFAKTNHSVQILDFVLCCRALIALRNGNVKTTIAHTVPELRVSRYACPRNDLGRNGANL